MIKAFLIALAALTAFDAVAWQGAARVEFCRQLVVAATVIAELDWSWE